MPDVPVPHGSGRGPTRRRVLAWFAVAFVAGAGAAFYRRSAILSWLAAPPLGSERPGRLGDAATATLDAVVVTLLDENVERTHYAEFFRWRAANLTGMRAVYERFSVRLDADARRHGAASFRTAPLAVRQHILLGYRRTRGSDRMVRSVFGRDDQRFARHVVREVFKLFSRTDAWVRVGYDAWPGVPRAIAHVGREGGTA